MALSARLETEDVAVSFVVTGPSSVAKAAQRAGFDGIAFDESTHGGKAFLSERTPDLLIWSAPTLAGPLLSSGLSEVPTRVLMDVGRNNAPLTAGRLPGQLGRRLRQFDHIIAVSDAAAAQVIGRDVQADRIQTLGQFRDLPPLGERSEAAADDIGMLLGPRPRWLAADVPLSELPLVIAAHRHVLRHATQVITMLMPGAPDMLDLCKSELDRARITHATWSETLDLPETTEVLLIDDASVPQAWYRAAPVTYLGGTLTRTPRSDVAAAVLCGSALVHGPKGIHTAEHLETLQSAGHTAAIGTPNQLGPTVARLMAPDAAAGQAMEALDHLTSGAEAINWVIDLIGSISSQRAAP